MEEKWRNGQIVLDGHGVVDSEPMNSREDALREVAKRIDDGAKDLSLTQYNGKWYVLQYIW